MPPAPNPEVAVEPPPPKEVKQETAQPQVPRVPAPATTAPQAVPERIAAVAAAPTQGAPNPHAPSVAADLEEPGRGPARAQQALSAGRAGAPRAGRRRSSSSASTARGSVTVSRAREEFGLGRARPGGDGAGAACAAVPAAAGGIARRAGRSDGADPLQSEVSGRFTGAEPIVARGAWRYCPRPRSGLCDGRAAGARPGDGAHRCRRRVPRSRPRVRC